MHQLRILLYIFIITCPALESMDLSQQDQDTKDQALINTVCNWTLDQQTRYGKVKELIASGANIHKNDLLMHAAWTDTPTITLLLQKGSDPNTHTKAYDTTVFLMILEHYYNADLVKLFLLYGADANNLAYNERHPLDIGSWCSSIVEALLQYGANPQAPSANGITILEAIKNKNIKVWASLIDQTLLKDKKRIVSLLEEACTAPHYIQLRAAYTGDTIYLTKQLTFMSPEEVDIWYMDNRTLLMVAAAHGHYAVVKALLKNGANPTLANALQQTPYDLAVKYNHQGTAQLLEKYSKAIAGEIMTRCFFSNRTSQERLPKDITNLIGLYIINAKL